MSFSKILIAPLDWGLGHTTRCLPLIDFFQSKGHSVTIAAPDSILSFIAQKFPGVRQISLSGYGIKYSKNRGFFLVKILLQIPKILKAIKKEHDWLKKILAAESFDLIISDNRYGLYTQNGKPPCVIMTHQLCIQSGFGKMANNILRQLHYRFLEKFKACWIVDIPGNKNLSGALANPKKLPKNARYIGLLSQMTLLSSSQDPIPTGDTAKKQILVLLSGPEPMRGLLEKELLPQCLALSDQYSFHFVAGNIHSTNASAQKETRIQYYNSLSTNSLYPLMKNADLVICRSGYSSLMDLVVMKKTALLIPTPGQVEQEYLSRYLKEKYDVLNARQGSINLKTLIEQAINKNPIQIDTFFPKLLETALQDLEAKTNTP